MALLIVVGTFVEYGTTARAARWYGAGRFDARSTRACRRPGSRPRSAWSVVAAGEVFAGPLTTLLAGGTSATQHAAESWFRIAVIGMPGVLLVLAGNGWMRGVQRTREPVRDRRVANAISAVASPILVYPLGLGLVGSAYRQRRRAGDRRRAVRARAAAAPRRSSRSHPAVMRAQLVMGRDLIVRSAAFQVAFLSAAAVAARIGTAQIAAHQIGLQLWEFTALLLDSFAIAAQSLVGAALGASDAGIARTLAWQVARWRLWAGCGFAAVYAAGWFVIPRLFTSDPAVLDQVHLLWPWFVGMLPGRPASCSPSTGCSSARATSRSCARSRSSPPSVRSSRSTSPPCTGTGASAACGPG